MAGLGSLKPCDLGLGYDQQFDCSGSTETNSSRVLLVETTTPEPEDRVLLTDTTTREEIDVSTTATTEQTTTALQEDATKSEPKTDPPVVQHGQELWPDMPVSPGDHKGWGPPGYPPPGDPDWGNTHGGEGGVFNKLNRLTKCLGHHGKGQLVSVMKEIKKWIKMIDQRDSHLKESAPSNEIEQKVHRDHHHNGPGPHWKHLSYRERVLKKIADLIRGKESFLSSSAGQTGAAFYPRVYFWTLFWSLVHASTISQTITIRRFSLLFAGFPSVKREIILILRWLFFRKRPYYSTDIIS